MSEQSAEAHEPAGGTVPEPPPGHRRISAPPSLTALATAALRDMILTGELRPGDRVVENQLTQELGVSRPPLREAMRVLEQEGLIVQVPRRGAVVTPLTGQDVYEILTLREDLERMAVRLGVPVRDGERLARLHRALEELERAVEVGENSAVTEANYRFHLAFVGLAGHRRLEDTYRSLSLQMLLCMSMNRRALADRESLGDNAARHRALVDLVETGDPERVLAGLDAHGHRSFLPDLDSRFLDSTDAMTWIGNATRSTESADPKRPSDDASGSPQ